MRLKRTYFCGSLTKEDTGKTVVLAGWVRKRRDHGGLIFIDLSDKWGIVQLVFNPQENPEPYGQAHSLRDGWVISLRGHVSLRPAESVNPGISTGEIEVLVEEMEILNPCLPLPFPPEDKIEVGEEVRLRYRYLDLRRPVMQRNLSLRYRVTKTIRNFLDGKGFMEIETPFLTRSTPEGARDYLVPSRVNPGQFYALPQSPQLFKQVLMVAGVDRYFQMARCFRDEDLRADRQPEHTQVDIELSFIQEEDIFELIEEMLSWLFQEILGISLPTPFPKLVYQEAMRRYGTDKPDLRFGMELIDLSSLISSGNFRVFNDVLAKGGQVKALRVPGGGSFSRKKLDDLKSWVTLYGASGISWILLRGKEIASPLINYFSQDILKEVITQMEAEPGDAIIFVADKSEVVAAALGQLRLHLARELNLIPGDKYQPVWIIDFPLFEFDSQGRLTPLHHPFTSPQEEDLPKLKKAPTKVRARAYDIVLNGEEIGGGSIRIHQRKIQESILELLGIDEVEARDKFGFLLEALSFGAPPHGGIALGLARLVMILAGEPSIREVIPFPKTQRAICLLTRAPSSVTRDQLKELHIQIEAENSSPI